VRYHAFRSLENYPADVWAQAASHGLYDKVRAVRIATADLYHLAGQQLVPSAAKKAYAQADAENKSYLRYQRDFAIGNIMMADYYLQESDYKNAIVHYLRGLKKDSLMNYARLNLSSAYNALQLNKESLKTLQDAEAIDPNNSRISYKLALLYYETGETENSDKAFKKAIRSGQAEAEVYYNYGLFLQQKGNLTEAEQMLLSGYKRYPSSEKINYALSYFYLNKQNYSPAKKYALHLFQLNPGNETYQALYKQLGILN
jgi:tetratricopeptide (TPR) repeat protein